MVSATTITATTPAGSAGTASVLVTTTVGTNAANSLFTYVAPPTVSAISPASGSTFGGTGVTITGTGFTGATAVTIGGTSATGITVVSATTITATTPAGAAGTASVLVTTPAGTNGANSLFIYVAPPTASAVSATVAYESTTDPITLSLGGGAATSVTVASIPAHGTATASGTSITYTPATSYSGSDSFSYTATNTGGTSPAATVTITVSAPAITVTPSTLPAGSSGTAYSQSLSATGGALPYLFSITAGALPAGLTLSAAGTISGTSTQAGTFNLTVQAKDGNNFTGSQAYSLILSGAIVTVSPSTIPAPTYGSGATYSQQFSASGGTLPYTYSSTGTLPVGLALSTSGLLSGTTTAGGAYSFSIKATDSSTGTGSPFFGSQTYAGSVGNAAPVPVNDSATVHANASTPIDVISNDTGVITSISVASQAAHGSAVASGTSIHYTPAHNYSGSDSFTYKATGPGGTSAAATVNVTVQPLGVPSGGNQTASAHSATTLTIHAAANAISGPFTEVNVVTQPASGQAIVKGLDILYVPDATVTQLQVVTIVYTLSNAFGASSNISVTITVTPSTQQVSELRHASRNSLGRPWMRGLFATREPGTAKGGAA